MKLNNLDLNKLKSLAAVANGGSLLLGAKLLGLTPSAVHQSIAKLEENLDQNLFHRSGKDYIITDAGKEILVIYERLIKDLEFFEEKSNPSPLNLQGTIKIALPLFYSKSIFLPIMKNFNLMYPNVRFHLTIQDAEKSLSDVVNFKIDLAIIDESRFQDKAEFEDINRQKKLVHLGYSTSSSFVENWYKVNHKKKVLLDNYHVINNIETLSEAIRLGMGIGIIPQKFIELFSYKNEIMSVKKNEIKVYNQLYLAQSLDYINGPLVKKFLEYFNA